MSTSIDYRFNAFYRATWLLYSLVATAFLLMSFLWSDGNALRVLCVTVLIYTCGKTFELFGDDCGGVGKWLRRLQSVAKVSLFLNLFTTICLIMLSSFSEHALYGNILLVATLAPALISTVYDIAMFFALKRGSNFFPAQLPGAYAIKRKY